MKIHSLSLLLAFWAFLTTSVLAWEKEDHEIFDLVSELENAEGKGTTFYSFLDVPPTASHADISKAFRKKSIQLHPDKNPGVKGVHERFARLSVIADILKGEGSRKRYDFFYKNGVPRWRGTDYYYSRFRPGLGAVLSFLVFLTSLLQYMVQRINFKKDLARIELILRRARKAAWGPKLIPVNGQRKVRVNLGDEHDEDGDVVGSRFLEMVVNEEGVYLLEPNGDLHAVDASSAPQPAITNTWFISLVKIILRKSFGSFIKFSSEDQPIAHDQKEDSDFEEHASDTSTPQSGEEGIGASTDVQTRTGKKLPAGKAGGMRRKNVRRR